jgi:hypothetical protein
MGCLSVGRGHFSESHERRVDEALNRFLVVHWKQLKEHYCCHRTLSDDL